jgi:hypothetical protein
LSPAEVARQTRKAYQEYNLKYGKAWLYGKNFKIY